MQLRRKSPEKASRRGNPEGLASQRWEGASHTETCSRKKMGTAHHAEGTSSEQRPGWLVREPRWAETQEERAVVRFEALDHGQTFGLYSEFSEKPWGWILFSLLVWGCELLLFAWYLNKVILAVLWYSTGRFMKLLLDIWSIRLFFTFLKCGFCLFTKPWSCVDCASVTICF